MKKDYPQLYLLYFNNNKSKSCIVRTFGLIRLDKNLEFLYIELLTKSHISQSYLLRYRKL